MIIITIYSVSAKLCALGKSQQCIGTGTGRLGNNRTSGDHPNNSIFEINQND